MEIAALSLYSCVNGESGSSLHTKMLGAGGAGGAGGVSVVVVQMKRQQPGWRSSVTACVPVTIQ